MQRLIVIFFLFSVFLTGCTGHRAQDRRRQKYERDSLSLVAQERSLAYYDSMLQVLVPQLDTMLLDFRYDKQERYEDKGFFSPRSSHSTETRYVKPLVREDGALFLRIQYVGTPVRGQSVVLKSPMNSAEFACSVHSFDADAHYELLTIDGDNAVSFVRLVDGWSDDSLVLDYVGENGHFSFLISAANRQAILQTYQLQVLMSDIQQLQKYYNQASLEMQKYQKRLEKR